MGDTTDFYNNYPTDADRVTSVTVLKEDQPAVFVQTMVFERADRYNYKYIAQDFGMPLYGIAINKVALQNDPPQTITVTVHRGE